MRAAMKDHPLALLFSRADGAYMANVGVAIKGGDANNAAALALTRQRAGLPDRSAGGPLHHRCHRAGR
jgi:hypothetical protein